MPAAARSCPPERSRPTTTAPSATRAAPRWPAPQPSSRTRRPTVGPRAPSSLSGTDHAPHSLGWRPIWGSCVSWYHEQIRSQTRRLALTGSQSTAPSSSSPARHANIEGVLVVDAANVIGSKPNGWWRDRPGAARQFDEQLRDAREVRANSVTGSGSPRRRRRRR